MMPPKIITGYKDYYIYPDGRVFRISNGKFVYPCKANGYLVVSLHKEGVRKTHFLHRIIASHFIPNPENKPQVNHINGVRYDNRVENLEWATAKENINHYYENHYDPSKDKRTHNRRLTSQAVIKIREMLVSGIKVTDIAKQFEVLPCIISQIKHNKTYQNI